MAKFISLLLHVVAVAAMFLIGYSIPPLVRPAHVVIDSLAVPSLYIPVPRAGGGDRSRERARKGQLPSRPLRRVFAPTIPLIDHPKLPLEVAMLDGPAVETQLVNLGDPFGELGGKSSGSKGLLGIGDYPGKGASKGGPNGAPGGQGAEFAPITRPPQLIFHPEPEYSDEARKARFQGVVVVSIVVDETGQPSRVKVVRGLGLGLDEKAVEAVARWRFRPALNGSRAVAHPALVEVSFRLL